MMTAVTLMVMAARTGIITVQAEAVHIPIQTGKQTTMILLCIIALATA
jgi:hypothetical protein